MRRWFAVGGGVAFLVPEHLPGFGDHPRDVRRLRPMPSGTAIARAVARHDQVRSRSRRGRCHRRVRRCKMRAQAITVGADPDKLKTIEVGRTCRSPTLAWQTR